MSVEQLKEEMMALPAAQRANLAQALWQSIGAAQPDTDEREAIRQSLLRDQEMSSNTVIGRPHDQVMTAARRSLKCD